jgi:ABC-type transport system involved in cytochrome bd biosynthesis fused ATPase/permease subunit
MAARNERGGRTTPNLRMPGSSRRKPNRGIFAILLSLLCPPLGLLLLWRVGIFRTRGRMLLTALATVEMAVIAVMMMPTAELQTATVMPADPVRATRAPESEVLTALSNMDELLYQQQLANVIAQGGSEADLMSDEEKNAQHEAEQETILNTIVYSVNSGAKLYHSAPMCGNQSNRRELTVRQAKLEGLGACSDCNPPVVDAISASEAGGH